MKEESASEAQEARAAEETLERLAGQGKRRSPASPPPPAKTVKTSIQQQCLRGVHSPRILGLHSLVGRLHKEASTGRVLRWKSPQGTAGRQRTSSMQTVSKTRQEVGQARCDANDDKSHPVTEWLVEAPRTHTGFMYSSNSPRVGIAPISEVGRQRHRGEQLAHGPSGSEGRCGKKKSHTLDPR